MLILSFRIVALRDLHPGEEIFMDYGDSWISAWDEVSILWLIRFVRILYLTIHPGISSLFVWQ